MVHLVKLKLTSPQVSHRQCQMSSCLQFDYITTKYEKQKSQDREMALGAEHREVVNDILACRVSMEIRLGLEGPKQPQTEAHSKRLKVATELFLCNCNISPRVGHINSNMFHHTSVCLSERADVSANQSSSIRFNQHVSGQEGSVSPPGRTKFYLKLISFHIYKNDNLLVYFTVVGPS